MYEAIHVLLVCDPNYDYNKNHVNYLLANKLSASYCFRASLYVNFLTVVWTAL